MINNMKVCPDCKKENEEATDYTLGKCARCGAYREVAEINVVDQLKDMFGMD